MNIISGEEKDDVFCRDTSDGKICYARGRDPKTFEDAKLFCNQASGDLFAPTSESDIEYVRNKFGSSFGLWIGIENPSGDNEKWVYSHNQDADVSFTNWHDGEPNIKDEKCGKMGDDKTTWFDIKCDKANDFICQFKVDPLCKFSNNLKKRW